jgi:hypothetical protein
LNSKLAGAVRMKVVAAWVVRSFALFSLTWMVPSTVYAPGDTFRHDPPDAGVTVTFAIDRKPKAEIRIKNVVSLSGRTFFMGMLILVCF